MSIPEAIAQIHALGIAKSSQYALLIGGVENIIPTRASKRLSISCEECFFPGMNVYTADVRHYGQSMKFPYAREYNNEMTMIFRVAPDFFEKKIFDAWIHTIVDPKSNDHEYYQNYTADIQILQISDRIEKKQGEDPGLIEGIIDRFKEAIDINFGGNSNKAAKTFTPIFNEKVDYRCVLENAFPIAVTEMPLGHANQNTYHRIAVTFTYKRWYTLPEVFDNAQQYDASESKIQESLNTTEKRAVGGRVADVITRGGQIYGKVFGRGNGSSLFKF